VSYYSKFLHCIIPYVFVLSVRQVPFHPRSVIFWTPLFHKYSSPYTYTDFIDSFVHPVMTMLTRNPPPRISQEIKIFLQLSKQSKVGDWYLYQNHTEIRIYGCQLAPYKLPKYLPMRLFALEYIGK